MVRLGGVALEHMHYPMQSRSSGHLLYETGNPKPVLCENLEVGSRARGKGS